MSYDQMDALGISIMCEMLRLFELGPATPLVG